MSKSKNKKIIIIIIGLFMLSLFVSNRLLLTIDKKSSVNLNNLLSYIVEDEEIKTIEQIDKEIDGIKIEIESLLKEKENFVLNDNNVDEYRKINDEIMIKYEKINELNRLKDFINHEEKLEKEKTDVLQTKENIKNNLEKTKENKFSSNTLIIIVISSIILLFLVAVIVLYFIIKNKKKNNNIINNINIGEYSINKNQNNSGNNI